MTRDPASAVPPSGLPAPRPFVPTPARPAVPVTPSFGAIPFAPRPRPAESGAAERAAREAPTPAAAADTAGDTNEAAEAEVGVRHGADSFASTDHSSSSDVDAWADVPIVTVESLAPDEPATASTFISSASELDGDWDAAQIVPVESIAPDDDGNADDGPAVILDGAEAARDLDGEPEAAVEEASGGNRDDVVPIASLAPDDQSGGEESGDGVIADADAAGETEPAARDAGMPDSDEASRQPVELLAAEGGGDDVENLYEAASAVEPLSTVLPGWEEWEAGAERTTEQSAGSGGSELAAAESAPTRTSPQDADGEEDAQFVADSADGGEEYADGGWDGHAPFPTDVFGFPDVPADFTLAAARGVADPGAWPSDEEWRRSEAEGSDDYRGGRSAIAGHQDGDPHDDRHGDDRVDPSIGLERSDAGAAAYGRGAPSDPGVQHLASLLERLASELRAGALGPVSVRPDESDQVQLTALLLAVARRERGGR